MITLFIDTSTTTLTVALIKNDKVLEESTVSSSEHSKYTLSEIEKLFKNNNIEPKSVNKIMVTNGPGSFTGIRIGVTIAKTYAWACNINIVPISTLKAYALSLNSCDYYVPMIDARRGFVYAGIYDKNYNEVMNDTYILLDNLKEKTNNLSNIIYISNDNIKDTDVSNVKLDVQKIYDYYKDDDGVNPHSLMPNYLKKTEAEEKFGGIND